VCAGGIRAPSDPNDALFEPRDVIARRSRIPRHARARGRVRATRHARGSDGGARGRGRGREAR
jgi:hypothetical protein